MGSPQLHDQRCEDQAWKHKEVSVGQVGLGYAGRRRRKMHTVG